MLQQTTVHCLATIVCSHGLLLDSLFIIQYILFKVKLLYISVLDFNTQTNCIICSPAQTKMAPLRRACFVSVPGVGLEPTQVSKDLRHFKCRAYTISPPRQTSNTNAKRGQCATRSKYPPCLLCYAKLLYYINHAIWKDHQKDRKINLLKCSMRI